MRCGVVRCGLEFSQYYNHTATYFYSHMCDVVYKMQFERLEVDIFSKFWTFPTLPKTNLSLCFGPNFKLLS